MSRKIFLLSLLLFVLWPTRAVEDCARATPGPSVFRNVRFFAPPGRACDQPLFVGDRRVYYHDDPVGHFVVGFCGVASGLTDPNREIQLVIYDARAELYRLVLTASDIVQPLFEFLLDLDRLALDTYTVTATLRNRVTGQVYAVRAHDFTKTLGPKRADTFPPDGIPIQVGPQEYVEDASWPISTGVPLPEGALRDVSRLALIENGTRVPAQITVRATWRPGGGDLKWIGLDFTARYDGFEPREYRLVRLPSPSAPPTTRLTAMQTDNEIVVDTGVLRFRVNRRNFAGIEQAFYDENGDGVYSPEELVIDGQGGPFLVDETGTVFAALRDPLTPAATLDSGVTIEESGTQRVTIRAVGWYVSLSGARLCKFVTRISAFAEQPMIRVSHRTLITYDTRQDRLTDVAWDVVSRYRSGTYHIGQVGGTPFSGPIPESDAGVFLHQDRADHFRVGTNAGASLGEGSRSDGWLSVLPDAPAVGRVTLALREIYQKFPKELELQTPAGSAARLVAHFWPKHGRDTFAGPPLDTSRENIYKIRYAHQGRTLRLQVPPAYRDAVTTYLTQELGAPDADGEITGMNRSNGQGLAIGNELALIFHSSDATADDVAQQVALFREDPHALASPAWNVATGVLGRLSATDPDFDPEGERLLDLAHPGYLRSIVEAGDEYGMWVYGNVHNNWDPSTGRAPIHRVWQASHYQNVWATWMLYFRGGKRDQLQWARINSTQFMDISTNNYDDGTGLHGRAGYQYHCKGFVPWGGESSLTAHWINPSAYLLRYYLTGDGRAWDVARLWLETSNRLGFEPYPPIPPGMQCRDWRNSSLRDRVAFLGEMVEYYQATWDPQALIHVIGQSRHLLDIPFHCMLSPGDHPIWTKQWFSRYYDLTRDERTVTRLRAWSAAGFDDLTVNAFLYRTTGNDAYLRRMLPTFYDAERILYTDEGHRYHGYSTWSDNYAAIRLQQIPYFLQALKDANLTVERGDRRMVYPGMPTYFVSLAGASWYFPRRGWPESSVIALALAQPGVPFNVRLDVLKSFGDPIGQLFVLAPPAPPIATSAFRPPDPGQLLYSVLRYDYQTSYPLTYRVPNPVAGLYRVETRANTSQAFAPFTDAPEAAVLRRRHFVNGGECQALFFGLDRQLFYLRPVPPYGSSITLRITGANGKENMYPASARPVYYRIETEFGDTVTEGNVFLYGRPTRTNAVINLPIAPGPPPTWRLYTASEHGPFIELIDGAEELLMAVKPEDLDTIYSLIPEVATTPLSCPPSSP